jgi:hypothetical protein
MKYGLIAAAQGAIFRLKVYLGLLHVSPVLWSYLSIHNVTSH